MVVKKKKSIKKNTSKPQVLLYRTQTCPFCHMAEEYFKAKKVKYKAIDVETNQKAAQEMIKKSGQMGVPVIDIKGKIIVGFDKASIKKALNLN